MRVYIVHPGASFSTHDVHVGLVAGLRAQGCDVYEGRLDTILNYHQAALAAGIAQGVFREPSIMVNLQHWASAHVTQHILEVWPDLVLVVSGGNYYIRDVRSLRRAGLTVAVLLTESPYLEEELPIAGQYDAAFTNERTSVAWLKQLQPHAHYLPHAYNTEVHQPGVADAAKACDAFFVGSWFEERRRLLLGDAWEGINLVWKGHDLSDTPDSILPNEETAAWYQSAAISLNMHRTTTSAGSGQHIAYAESLNPRAYEIAACRGFQLCDNSRAELRDIFGDVPTYRAGDAGDLTRQVRHFLAHPDERERVAAAMHQAVQPHSWTARAGQILEVLT